MDLFEYARQQEMKAESPLAARLRPRTLDEFLGQEHILGPGRMLRRAIESDQLSSVILWGPPGTGKTTLARIIANATRAHFEQINAVTAGVADIRRVVEEAGQRRGMHGKKTILFVDEIHRFNKSQQDALLPFVEDGLITLIGATTQNPMIDCNPALVSRSRIFALEPLRDEHLRVLLDRALKEPGRGLGNFRAELAPEAMEHLVRVAAGDARSALNALELAVLTTPASPDGVRRIDLAAAEESIQKRALRYDKAGDQHYDAISAFIKSIRGSDPDAAVYWLARMTYAGEDPRFIARRMVIAAAEDIGNADPMGLVVATSAAQAVEMVGLPEGRIPLAQAAVYLACAPKSNASYLAINSALGQVEEGPVPPVPVHLRGASYRGAERLGHGQGYVYPHDHPGHWVKQQYLPDGLEDKRFYDPSGQGLEADPRWRKKAEASNHRGESD